MKKLVAAFVVAFGLCSGTQAAIISFSSVDNGWYSANGTHTADNTNIATGWGNNTYYNSFFSFDLSGLGPVQSITSASITFKAGNGTYMSWNSSETLELWDVASALGTSSTAVFNDLQSGVKYGQATVNGSYGGAMQGFTVNLGSVAFADILADNTFSIGAHLASISRTTSNEALWSGSNGTGAAVLKLDFLPGATLNAAATATAAGTAVSEPGTLALLGVACAGLGMLRRRRKSA